MLLTRKSPSQKRLFHGYRVSATRLFLYKPTYVFLFTVRSYAQRLHRQ